MVDEIFFIENDEGMRKTAEDILELKLDGDTEVYTFEDPERALEEVKLEAPDVVVADYLLNGETTGLDVAASLNGETDAIIYTGYERSFIETDYQKGGFDEVGALYVQKGNGYSDLAREIEKLR